MSIRRAGSRYIGVWERHSKTAKEILQINTAQCFIVGGLASDIAGVLMLYIFGISALRTQGILMYGGPSPQRTKLYDWLARLGLILVIIGFVLQGVGALV